MRGLYVLITVVLFQSSYCIPLSKYNSVVKFSQHDKHADWPPTPNWIFKTKMARYLVHYAEWGVLSAFSSDLHGLPVGTVQSFADGTLDNSTGIPFFYIASISDTAHNIKYNNTVSLTVSLAESSICQTKGEDPEEPPCARITLTGQMVRTPAGMVPTARKFLFTRHKAMANWPTGHDWNFYQLDIQYISMLDFYGGATHIKPKDYFAAKP